MGGGNGIYGPLVHSHLYRYPLIQNLDAVEAQQPVADSLPPVIWVGQHHLCGDGTRI